MNDSNPTSDVTGVSITRVETFGPMSEEILKELPTTLQREVAEAQQQDKLTQFLGVSLRALLPYAEQEVGSLREIGSRDNDSDVLAEAMTGHLAIQRANVALNTLNASSLSVEELDDDAFDDDFQVVFDESEDDPES